MDYRRRASGRWGPGWWEAGVHGGGTTRGAGWGIGPLMKPLQKLSWYAFLHDFTDRGIDATLGHLQETGASGANVAMVYHAARDVLPINPRRRLRYMIGGTHYYPADRSLYSDSLPPPRVDPELDGSDPMRDVVDGLDAHHMRFDAWVVFGHDSPIGCERPDLAHHNAF